MHITVTELPEFIQKSTVLLTADENEALINYLSSHPLSGDLLQGTGGIRKLRWARGHRGKSGGVRVVYYYYNASIPLYLLTLFGKNEKANLSKSERNELAKLANILTKTI